MSKRAEQRALEVYPNSERDKTGFVTFFGFSQKVRNYYIEGYEQAEKDTIERVCEWLKKNATYINPRTGRETCMINLNALREAISED